MVHSLLSGIPDLLDDDLLPKSGLVDVLTDVPPQSDGLDSTSSDEIENAYEPFETTDEQSSASCNTVLDSVSDLDNVSDTTLFGNHSSLPQEKDLDAVPSLCPEPPLLQPDVEKIYDEPSRPTISVPSSFPHRPRITLTALLTRADELYSLYPPTHNSVAVSSIMGPQSVIFTWSEQTSERLDDDEAESIVTRPELIVRPYADPNDSDTVSPTEKGRPQKMRDPSRSSWIAVDRRTFIAGAVVVIGIGLAVYGIRTRSTATQGGSQYGRRLRTWIGRALAGASD